MQRCGGSPREISPSPRSGRENTAHEGEREEGDWGNADWMGRNRIYEEARKQSGVDRGWGERERETEISTGSTPGLLLHVRVEIRVGLIRIGRLIADGGTSLGNFFDRVKLWLVSASTKKKTWNYYGFSSEFELIWINLCK